MEFKPGDIIEVTLSGDSKFLGIVMRFDMDGDLVVRFLEEERGTVIRYGCEYVVSVDSARKLFSYPEYLSRNG